MPGPGSGDKEINAVDETLIKAFAALLQHLPGQAPADEDLRPWAERLASAWRDELLGGEAVDLAEALGGPMALKTRRQEVALSGIRFSLVCPHHLTLALGEASVRYQPRQLVAGPSGLVRLVDAATRRRILQEEAAELIADTLEHVLQPQSIEVVLAAEQTCVSCRGVRRQGTNFITRVTRGSAP
jgi:GTP cyclohydrolase I